MIFTKRNAIVGFVTLKALEKYRDKRRRKEKRALKRAGAVALVVLAVGVLAGAVAFARKRRSAETESHEGEPEHGAAEDAKTTGNGRVSPEPAPAT